MRTAALQSRALIVVIIEGKVTWPGSRNTVTSKPRVCSDCAIALIEYGESVRPWTSSAWPCGCGCVSRKLRL
jgi:hypothetical protein